MNEFIWKAIILNLKSAGKDSSQLFEIYMGKYSFFDICRKAVYIVIRSLGNVLEWSRKCRFWYYTRAWPAHVQGRIYFTGIAIKATIGQDANFYSGVIMELAEQGKLSIGDGFTLSYGSIIACRELVSIGDHVMIGEYSSIRDTTHGQSANGVAYARQKDFSAPVIIGNNVWIGRGSIVLPGTVIGDGVIIGANSLVKGNLLSHHLYAGTPLRMIRSITAPA